MYCLYCFELLGGGVLWAESPTGGIHCGVGVLVSMVILPLLLDRFCICDNKGVCLFILWY